MRSQIGAAVTATFIFFFGCEAVARMLTSSPLAAQVLLKVLVAAGSAAAMWLWPRRSDIDWGLRRASSARWTGIALKAIVLGGVASSLVLGAGGTGLQAALGTTNLIQAVLVVWILSSVSEELLTRGWLQGVLHRWRDRSVLSVTVPALVSGVVFGALHVSLFFKQVDSVTATVVVLFASILGVWAGTLRDRFGSLLPPVVAHIGFNVGGALGAVLFVIAYRIGTGRLPPQLLQ